MLQQYDERNNDILIYVGDGLYKRSEARVSVFDSVVQGGDAVWEGLRLYRDGIFLLDRHLDRLFDSANAMHFRGIPDRSDVIEAIRQTLQANKMETDVHIRLTLTRGEKITSGMDPRLNAKGCCLIVLAEYKPLVYDNENGIRVLTSSIRRNAAQQLDSKMHHNNLINNILAKIQANVAGMDAALMLDINGFASELNGTNIFMIKRGRLLTPHADACLPGITRSIVLEIADELDMPVVEKNISLTELYAADCVFCTGTMGELTPITEIDGRSISQGEDCHLLQKINAAFKKKIPELSVSL
jgi:branched-chain amino acid aminotransferase